MTSTPPFESPFLNVAEAAVYLRISERALENFRAFGGGPWYRKHGARVIYHIEDLDEWSHSRRYADTGGGVRK
jgi:hypothetical protein